jgi:membrane protease YdiL (CAAX protease family)
LLPKLLPLGREKALIISGLIWGLWHLLFVLLIDYESYPNKIAGGLIFTALITLLGIYIGALTLNNKSTLLASYVHGVFNAQDHGI